MDRRNAVVALIALGVTPLPSLAQQAGKVWRIGFLTINTPDPAYLDAFKQGLRELGYV